MSKEQNELDKLKAEHESLKAQQSANDEILRGLDPETDRDEFHRTAQKSKHLGEEVGRSKNAVNGQLNEVEAAKKAAIEKQAREVAGKQKEQVVEAKDVETSDPATLTPNPERADSSPQKLDEKTAEGIQSTQDGQKNNYQHESKTNNNLTDVTQAQEQAQEVKQGLEQEKQKEQQQDYEIDRWEDDGGR